MLYGKRKALAIAAVVIIAVVISVAAFSYRGGARSVSGNTTTTSMIQPNSSTIAVTTVTASTSSAPTTSILQTEAPPGFVTTAQVGSVLGGSFVVGPSVSTVGLNTTIGANATSFVKRFYSNLKNNMTSSAVEVYVPENHSYSSVMVVVLLRLNGDQAASALFNALTSNASATYLFFGGSGSTEPTSKNTTQNASTASPTSVPITSSSGTYDRGQYEVVVPASGTGSSGLGVVMIDSYVSIIVAHSSTPTETQMVALAKYEIDALASILA